MSGDSLDSYNPLDQLRALRQEAEKAETYEQIRAVHLRISSAIIETIAQKPHVDLQEIADVLGTTIEKQRRGLRLGIYLFLKEIKPDLFKDENISEDRFNLDFDDDLKEAGITLIQLPTIIVPPDTGKTNIKNGTGEGIDEKKLFDRTKYTIEVLQMLNIDVSVCEFKNGIIEDNMMRKTSYVLIKIPQLNKMVLVCDEEGNRTFVVYTLENEAKFINMLKDKLKEDPLVQHFVWNSDIDAWKIKLMNLLTMANPEWPKAETKPPVKEKPVIENKKIVKMDAEYFTPENVKADLKAFACTLGAGKTPLDINTNNIRGKEAFCSNCELVKWYTYMERARSMFGFVTYFKKSEERKNKRAVNNRKKIINKLLITAGYKVEEYMEYPKMDVEYYTAKNVKADLEAYAKKLGKGKTMMNITTANVTCIQVVCSNGEPVKGQKYLSHAGKILGFGKSDKEVHKKQAEILKKLFKIAGYEIKEYPKMDAEYFTAKNVSADLEAYAKKIGEDKSPLDITVYKTFLIEFICSNGEILKGNTYFNRAGVALGFGKNSHEVSNITFQILNSLLKIAGFEVEDKKDYPPMDSDYFSPENARADLEKYAEALGKGRTAIDLNTNNISNEIICCNGEPVKWHTYINRAGVGLKIAKNAKSAQFKRIEILEKLKQIAGY